MNKVVSSAVPSVGEALLGFKDLLFSASVRTNGASASRTPLAAKGVKLK